MLEASREVFGDIPLSLRSIFYAAALIAVAIFFIGSWFKVSIWLRGRYDPSDCLSKKSASGLIKTSLLYIFSVDCLIARRVMQKSKLRGIMLIFVYWGFIILFMGTLIVAVDYDLGLNILKGKFYLYFSLILDITGGLALISLSFYILRRYVFSRHSVVSGWDDAIVLTLMFLVVFSGFCIEGIRLARLNPPFMDWSPVGAIFSLIFTTFMGGISFPLLYRVFWMFHAISAFTFIAFIPFSKQFHMFAAQITTLEASKRRTDLWGIVHE
ncbi:MAG: hypothetical protein OHK0032_18320 [Thermodesulfovibrionales bacterium]